MRSTLKRSALGWRTSAALLVGLTIALSGCSDPGGKDYVDVEIGKLTVDRPSAWSVETPVQAPWTKGFRSAPDSVQQIQLSGDFGDYITASQAMGTLIGQAQVGLKGFTVVQSRDVTIKGATTGRATRFTIEDNSGSQVSGEWVVAAHWPYPQSVAVSMLTPQFDPELERRVLDSMQLRPNLN